MDETNPSWRMEPFYEHFQTTIALSIPTSGMLYDVGVFISENRIPLITYRCLHRPFIGGHCWKSDWSWDPELAPFRVPHRRAVEYIHAWTMGASADVWWWRSYTILQDICWGFFENVGSPRLQHPSISGAGTPRQHSKYTLPRTDRTWQPFRHTIQYGYSRLAPLGRHKGHKRNRPHTKKDCQNMNLVRLYTVWIFRTKITVMTVCYCQDWYGNRDTKDENASQATMKSAWGGVPMQHHRQSAKAMIKPMAANRT